jgi:hypothetical protein
MMKVHEWKCDVFGPSAPELIHDLQILEEKGYEIFQILPRANHVGWFVFSRRLV